MAEPTIFPVPEWVRTAICLAPFLIAAFVAFVTVTKNRSAWPLYVSLVPCGLVITFVLSQS